MLDTPCMTKEQAHRRARGLARNGIHAKRKKDKDTGLYNVYVDRESW